MKILIKDIYHDAKFNCRGVISPISVSTLAKDIKEHGLLQQLVIQPMPKDHEMYGKYPYRLIAGHRRHIALQINEAVDADCIIKENLSDIEALVLNFAENIQREEMTLLQEANTIKRFLDANMTRAQICHLTKKTDGWVQTRTYLLALPEYMQLEADAGILKQQDIRNLYSAKENPDAQKHLYLSLKNDNAKGVKSVNTAKILGKNKKGIRKPHEITEMTVFLMDTFGPSLLTRGMAWCSGLISDAEFYADMYKQAKNSEIPFEIPQYLQQDVAIVLAKEDKK
jgi:ParB/RepB/Spo0J family partition protein